MILLQAPVPGVQTTSVLPNPSFNDAESIRASVRMQQSMDGTLYTTVKRGGRSKLLYEFSLSRAKALELEAFYAAYFDKKIRMTNHKGEVWEGYITVNPFETTAAGRAGGWPGDEVVSATIEFEGEKL